MKAQKDMLFGEDLNKYKYIPKLLATILEKKIRLKNDSKSSLQDMYQKMFMTENWTDEQEDQLHALKVEINSGNWQNIHDLQDILLSTQLLYDWLEDSVLYVINPEKLDIIFEQKSLGFLIKKHICDRPQYNRDSRHTLFENIKQDLRGIDSETIIFVAHFANEFKPSDQTLQADYKNMISRLCIPLLGFSFDSIYANPDKEEAQCLQYYVNNLCLLVEFFATIICYDLDSSQEDISEVEEAEEESIMASLQSPGISKNRKSYSSSSTSKVTGAAMFRGSNLLTDIKLGLFSSKRKKENSAHLHRFNSLIHHGNIGSISAGAGVGVGHHLTDHTTSHSKMPEEQNRKSNSNSNSEDDKNKFFFQVYQTLDTHYRKHISSTGLPVSNSVSNSNTSSVYGSTALSDSGYSHFVQQLNKFVTLKPQSQSQSQSQSQPDIQVIVEAHEGQIPEIESDKECTTNENKSNNFTPPSIQLMSKNSNNINICDNSPIDSHNLPILKRISNKHLSYKSAVSSVFHSQTGNNSVLNSAFIKSNSNATINHTVSGTATSAKDKKEIVERFLYSKHGSKKLCAVETPPVNLVAQQCRNLTEEVPASHLSDNSSMFNDSSNNSEHKQDMLQPGQIGDNSATVTINAGIKHKHKRKQQDTVDTTGHRRNKRMLTNSQDKKESDTEFVMKKLLLLKSIQTGH